MARLGAWIAWLVLCALVGGTLGNNVDGQPTGVVEEVEKFFGHHSLPTCRVVEDTEEGRWEGPSRWQPRNCTYVFYSNQDFAQCFKTKLQRIGWFGDSLLLNVWTQLATKLEAAGLGRDAGEPKSFYQPGGRRTFVFKPEYKEFKFEFYWAPSVFHFSFGHSSFSSLDVAVFSMGVWDMGTYYKGATMFHKRLSSILASAKRKGPRIYKFGLHRLWNTRCKDKTSPCSTCNTDSKQYVFREAIRNAAACTKVHLIDTYGFTNTQQASADGSDAAHFGEATTKMEATHFENQWCTAGFAQTQQRQYACSGAAIDFDKRLARHDRDACVPKDFKPRKQNNRRK